MPQSLLLPLALVAVLSMTTPLRAADVLVDGVPLPADAKVASVPDTDAGDARHWAGAWVGAWGGVLKTVLVVEAIAADGSASVVYAIGDNPALGIRQAWSRHTATLTAQRLTITGTGFSVSYDRNPRGRLLATYTRGAIVSRAEMSPVTLAALLAPGGVMPWTHGQSERLPTALIEDGRPVALEVVIFRPDGAGPFPLAVINHGSTGRGTDVALFRQTWVDAHLAAYLNDRGWLVAFPQRRGRGRSDGRYDEGFAADRAAGYTCDFATSLADAERALEDIDTAVAALRRRPDVAPSRILIGGQSRGGILSIAWAGMHPEQSYGVINVVGGWLGTGCDTASGLNGTLFQRGARFHRPTLWLYGHGDPYYSIEHSRSNFARFQQAGGQGHFLEFDVPGGNGHGVLNAPALWEAPVEEYLTALNEK